MKKPYAPNPNKEVVEKIKLAIQRNEGYCPCKPERTPDTKCMCKEMKETNHCCCGLFVPSYKLVGRKKPYTYEEIQSLQCCRCGKQAKYQWQICSDGNKYRPICEDCDIKLNELVLKFMDFPNIYVTMKKYVEKIKGEK